MKKNNGYISAQAAAIMWKAGNCEFSQCYSKQLGKYTGAAIVKNGVKYKLNQKNATELKKIINNK